MRACDCRQLQALQHSLTENELHICHSAPRKMCSTMTTLDEVVEDIEERATRWVEFPGNYRQEISFWRIE